MHVIGRSLFIMLRLSSRRSGVGRGDPRLMFGKVIHAASRKQVGQPMRRRDTREHVALYIKAFNAWATGDALASPSPHDEPRSRRSTRRSGERNWRAAPANARRFASCGQPHLERHRP
jgi:hypothetical protein